MNNAKKIWDFLKSKGFNDYACAGIIGNFDCESGLNPRNLQDSYHLILGFTDDQYVNAIDSCTYTRDQFVNDCAGAFLAQWTYPTRKAALYDYAKSTGRSIGDLQMQLEFFYKELKELFPLVLNALICSSSVREASDIMLLNYERPADMSVPAQVKRASYAQKYYIQFSTNNGGAIKMGYNYYTKGVPEKVSAHFYSTEFDCHGHGCCSETIINERLPELLEMIRKHFNTPITITSPYRCQTHNSRIGGAAGSRHSKGDAADIVVKGVAPRTVAQYAESIGILGIGLYETAEDGYFVHIDTRDRRSFWYGQSEQPRTTFGAYVGTTATTTTNVQNTNNLDTILNIGDSGSAVKSLQEKLIQLGYSCGVEGADGKFGMGTYSAVRKFQAVHKLAVDGIAGYNTLSAIDLAVKEQSKHGNPNSFVGSKIKVTASVLNVRSGAGSSYSIIKQLKYGTLATVVDERSGWCKLDNPSGWVSKDYIRKN